MAKRQKGRIYGEGKIRMKLKATRVHKNKYAEESREWCRKKEEYSKELEDESIRYKECKQEEKEKALRYWIARRAIGVDPKELKLKRKTEDLIVFSNDEEDIEVGPKDIYLKERESWVGYCGYNSENFLTYLSGFEGRTPFRNILKFYQEGVEDRKKIRDENL